MLIGVTFTRDTSILRSFLSSSSSSCLHLKTAALRRRCSASSSCLLCCTAGVLVLLLTLLAVLMMLPSVLKDTHLDALIQQHLFGHVALCHLECHWPLWRPVLRLTLHPVTRALDWCAHHVGCVWHLSWRISWGPPHLTGPARGTRRSAKRAFASGGACGGPPLNQGKIIHGGARCIMY